MRGVNAQDIDGSVVRNASLPPSSRPHTSTDGLCQPPRLHEPTVSSSQTLKHLLCRYREYLEVLPTPQGPYHRPKIMLRPLGLSSGIPLALKPQQQKHPRITTSPINPPFSTIARATSSLLHSVGRAMMLLKSRR